MIAISLSGSMASKNTQNYKILATGETTIFCFTCSDSIPQQFKSNNHSIHVVAPAGCHLSMTKACSRRYSASAGGNCSTSTMTLRFCHKRRSSTTTPLPMPLQDPAASSEDDATWKDRMEKKYRELEAENRELRQKLDDEYDRWKQTREQLDVCHVALAELMAEKQAAQRRNEDP